MNILPPEKADATGPCYGGHRKTGNRLAQRQLVQAGIHRACRGLAPCRAHPPAPPDRGSPGIYNMVHRFCISAPPLRQAPPSPPLKGGVLHLSRREIISTPRPYKEGDKAPPPSPPSRGGVLHLSRREIISTPPPPRGHALKHMPRSEMHLTPGTPRNACPEAKCISRRARPETHAPKRNASHGGHVQKCIPRSEMPPPSGTPRNACPEA